MPPQKRNVKGKGKGSHSKFRRMRNKNALSPAKNNSRNKPQTPGSHKRRLNNTPQSVAATPNNVCMQKSRFLNIFKK